jgi:hypothetical protein
MPARDGRRPGRADYGWASTQVTDGKTRAALASGRVHIPAAQPVPTAEIFAVLPRGNCVLH